MSTTKKEEYTDPNATESVSNVTNPYVYTPGSAAPTTGNAMDYATWLQGSTKYQAEQDRIKAEEQAKLDRQRSVVDADSAYEKGLATYGANAENLASMGLSGSGYGEYLTGKAYATRNAGIKAADALYAQRKDQALYTEGQVNSAADQQYALDLLGFKEQTNASFQSDYNSALGGAAIETIQQNGNWAYYTPEQQDQILGATYVNTFKLKIDGGESLDTFKITTEWNKLNPDQQQMLTNYYSQKAAERLKTMIDGGKTLDEIKKDVNSGWNNLTIDEQSALEGYYNQKAEAKRAEEEADQKLKEAAAGTNYVNWLGALNEGEISLEELKHIPGFADLSNEQLAILAAQDLLNKANEGVSLKDLQKNPYWEKIGEAEKNEIEYIAENYDAAYKQSIEDVAMEYSESDLSKSMSKTDFGKELRSSGYETNEINEIISKWQNFNYEKIKNNRLSRAELSNLVSQGIIKQSSADAHTYIKTSTDSEKEAEYNSKIKGKVGTSASTGADYMKDVRDKGYDEAFVEYALAKWQDENYIADFKGKTVKLSDLQTAVDQGRINEKHKASHELLVGETLDGDAIKGVVDFDIPDIDWATATSSKLFETDLEILNNTYQIKQLNNTNTANFEANYGKSDDGLYLVDDTLYIRQTNDDGKAKWFKFTSGNRLESLKDRVRDSVKDQTGQGSTNQTGQGSTNQTGQGSTNQTGVTGSNAKKSSKAWSISDLNGGGNGGFLGLGGGDNIRLFVDGTTYYLETSGVVADSTILDRLNIAATGDKLKSPSVKGAERWINPFGATLSSGTSEEEKGRLLEYGGNLYLYTRKGWKQLTAREKKGTKIEAAIAALGFAPS